MKYIIEEYVLNEYNACSKARKDISHFVLQDGYKSLFRNDKSKIRHSKLSKVILTLKLYTQLLRLNQSDIVFVQTSMEVLTPILFIKSLRKFKLIYLIHDLFPLRFNTSISIEQNKSEIEKDIHSLCRCDYVIAHNPFMIKRLKDFGCTVKLISLGIFDYETKQSPKKRSLPTTSAPVLVLAGSLSNPFLLTIDELCHQHQIPFYLYGKTKLEFRYSVYKGAVDPDVLPDVIDGNYGLIWNYTQQDPSETDCYELLNNPHKLSMYIVAGLPVITWRKSAAGKFIDQEGIGITVNRFDEIFDKIKQTTPQQYNEMVDNCLLLRRQFVNGEFIKKALSQIE